MKGKPTARFDLNRIRENLGRVGDDKLAREEAAKKFKRDDELKGTVHRMFIWGIRMAFLIFVVIVTIRLFHLVAPPCWYWLSDVQVQGLDKLLYSGALGGFIGRYINKVF